MNERRRPWHCDVVGSFAWRTCTVRWPKIVRDLAVDVPASARALEHLADEIERGVLAPLTAVDDDDAIRFADVAAFVAGPWTALPWYVGEAFLYARIRAAVGWSVDGVDPFFAAKKREEATLPADDDSDDLAVAFDRALWGNRGDLSLPSARGFTHEHDSDLVVDDRAAAFALVDAARSVAILADNAGLELFRDLQLIRALNAQRKRVTLFVKDRPFFVSDALVDDVLRAGRFLRREAGPVELVAHPYFTGPGFLHVDVLPADLRAQLAANDVVIAKGDCNSRRLVGDVPFAATDRERFDHRVDLGVQVIALRTLKAEVLVGADAAACAAAAKQSADWLVSGRFGVVQVAGGNNVVDSNANAP